MMISNPNKEGSHMKTFYVSLTSDLTKAAPLAITADAVGVWDNDRKRMILVPRWLAEKCKFELDHEHDDELAEADA